MANFLQQAEALIKQKKQWANGETVVLWQSGPMQVWVKNEGGFLAMTFFIEGARLTERFYERLTVGVFFPGEGWKFSRDAEYSYTGWINKVKASPAYRRVVAPRTGGALHEPAPRHEAPPVVAKAGSFMARCTDVY